MLIILIFLIIAIGLPLYFLLRFVKKNENKEFAQKVTNTLSSSIQGNLRDSGFSKEMSDHLFQNLRIRDMICSNQKPNNSDFGYCASNPIFTGSIDSSDAYLSRLRTEKGECVQWIRKGSICFTGFPNIKSVMIDIYQIYLHWDYCCDLYICPYGHNFNCAPNGFKLSESYSDENKSINILKEALRVGVSPDDFIVMHKQEYLNSLQPIEISHVNHEKNLQTGKCSNTISVFKVIVSYIIGIVSYLLSYCISFILLALLVRFLNAFKITRALFNFLIFLREENSILFIISISAFVSLFITEKIVLSLNRNNTMQSSKTLFGIGMTFIIIGAVFFLVNIFNNGSVIGNIALFLVGLYFSSQYNESKTS